VADREFALKIREHFDGDLTGVIVVSGTRTTYLFERGQPKQDLGAIDAFQEYANFLVPRYHQLIEMFFNLGGQNLIIPLYPYQVFYARGHEYAHLAMETTKLIVEDAFVSFYKELNIDPYFAGLDGLEQFPPNHIAHSVCQRIKTFRNQWDYQKSRYKLIWEIAPVPLYSFWSQSQNDTNQNLAETILAINDLREIYEHLYKYYTKTIYGVTLPMPHFYIGSNRNGELKLRSMYPISMLAGDPFRLFYLPYPTLYLKENVLKAILNDLAFGEPLRAIKKDYSGQFTVDMIHAEQNRIAELSHDPNAVVGMTRHIPRTQ